MKNSQLQILKTAALIPLVFAQLFFLKAQDRPLGLTTVCIDAGHGGKDPGCISKDGSKTQEKDITLSIAKYLSEKITSGYPEMKVVLTRSDDTFLELRERTDVANKNNSDLFISIHVNAVDTKKNKNWTSVSGFSVHTLGQSRTGKDLFSFNMEVCKRENSVILLEEDYSTKYQGFDPSEPESYIFFNLMQNSNLGHSLSFAEYVDNELAKGPIKNNRGISQDPFYVLWGTTMPSVLVEVGFITNASDLAIMKTEGGRKSIANRIYNAFKAFKKKYDATLNIDSPLEGTPAETMSAPEAEASSEPVAPVAPALVFGSQVLASGKLLSEDDKRFQGYKALIVKEEKLYKYIIGISDDSAEAKKLNKDIRSIFPDAFVVCVKNGKIVRE